MNAQEIIQEFKKNSEALITAEIPFKGAIIGLLERACGNTANRYLVTKVLTGKTSSKLLSENDWYGLLCLVQPEKPAGGHWQSARTDAELHRICQILLTTAVDQPGQQTLPFLP